MEHREASSTCWAWVPACVSWFLAVFCSFMSGLGSLESWAYLREITGKAVSVSTSAETAGKGKSVIVIGEKMARAVDADLGPVSELGETGFVIRSFDKEGTRGVVIAGRHPHGTNSGIATFM